MRKIPIACGSVGYAGLIVFAACTSGSELGGAGEPNRGIGDGEIGGTGTGAESFGPGATAGPSDVDASGASAGSGGGSAPPSMASPMAPAEGGATPAPSDGEIAGSTTTPGGGDGTLQSGILTAGAWDDNRNFARFTQFRADLLDQHLPGLIPTTNAEHSDAYDLFKGSRAAKTTLDVSLVIDTTGSMGDEIQYLQTEFLAISERIETAHPDAEQRWSLVVYKDEGDEYVVRWFDFRADAAEFRTHLMAQSAGGGGDFPEAPDQALTTMNQLAWRSGAANARVAFWVADAPHHDEVADKMAEAIRGAADQDIHIYPVASSGIDEMTELTMRSAAQLTGGRYLFLTDDSGVGGSHIEPSIPCYFVTRLDAAIVRMVDIELSGGYREPTDKEIIRTGGDPQDGACTLDSGDEVLAF
jgi:hypothetical protein